MSEAHELEAALEAMLFVAGEALPRERLLEIFDESDRADAAVALDAVLERYAPALGRGIVAEEVAGGVRLATRPECAPYLRRFVEAGGRSKLSMAALETLAIVAYRQPITAPEVQELRGVDPSAVLGTLLDRRMIKINGRKQVVGRPFLYGTTRHFLTHFGLNSVDDLPPLEEFEETMALEAFEQFGLSFEEGLEEGIGEDLDEALEQEAAEEWEAAEEGG